MYDAARAH